MEAISMLLEASEAQDCEDFAMESTTEAETKAVNPDIEAVDAILHLRGDSFDSTGVRGWSESLRASPSFGRGENDAQFFRRRRAMSEPWVTMSSSIVTSNNEVLSPSKHSTPFHPVLLQPRFPLPLMAIQTQPHAPGMPHRMPTIEEFSSLCNTNGRIGIYTKEEREVLIRRFRDKKKKRIWKKKIRYECRKDLADRRTRVKGRFVKAPGGASPPDKPIKPIKIKQQNISMVFQASGSLSSDNTSEETNSSDSYGRNLPSLSFRLPIKKTGTDTTLHEGGNIRKRQVRPLQLDKFDNAEDRLKYLASILGGDVSDSLEDDDDEMDVDEVDSDDEGEEGDEEDDGDHHDQHHHEPSLELIMPPSSTPPASHFSGRPVRASRLRSGSEIDYRRPRRHSIAY